MPQFLSKSVFRYALGALIALLLVASATFWQSAEAASQTHTVTIDVKDGIVTYSHPVIRVKPGDRVQWISANGDFGIQFSGISPCQRSNYSGLQNAAMEAVVRSDASPGRYKYTVAVVVGRTVIIDDPEMEVSDIGG